MKERQHKTKGTVVPLPSCHRQKQNPSFHSGLSQHVIGNASDLYPSFEQCYSARSLISSSQSSRCDIRTAENETFKPELLSNRPLREDDIVIGQELDAARNALRKKWSDMGRAAACQTSQLDSLVHKKNELNRQIVHLHEDRKDLALGSAQLSRENDDSVSNQCELSAKLKLAFVAFSEKEMTYTSTLEQKQSSLNEHQNELTEYKKRVEQKVEGLLEALDQSRCDCLHLEVQCAALREEVKHLQEGAATSQKLILYLSGKGAKPQDTIHEFENSSDVMRNDITLKQNSFDKTSDINNSLLRERNTFATKITELEEVLRRNLERYTLELTVALSCQQKLRDELTDVRATTMVKPDEQGITQTSMGIERDKLIIGLDTLETKCVLLGREKMELLRETKLLQSALDTAQKTTESFVHAKENNTNSLRSLEATLQAEILQRKIVSADLEQATKNIEVTARNANEELQKNSVQIAEQKYLLNQLQNNESEYRLKIEDMQCKINTLEQNRMNHQQEIQRRMDELAQKQESERELHETLELEKARHSTLLLNRDQKIRQLERTNKGYQQELDDINRDFEKTQAEVRTLQKRLHSFLTTTKTQREETTMN